MGDEQNEQERTVIRMDGSYGAGIDAYVTIVTADRVTGTKDKTYQFPYMLINVEVLTKLMNNNLILGYRVEKIIPEGQKALVIKFGPDGAHGGMEE